MVGQHAHGERRGVVSVGKRPHTLNTGRSFQHDRGKLPPSLAETLHATAREYVIAAMAETKGNLTKAAIIAGYNRTRFYALCKRLGVRIV